MYRLKEYLICFFAVILILNIQNKSFSEESEIYDILNVIQKDLKTLEKAVYSGDSFSTSQSSDSNLSQDTLTRHLLKLSDIEQQFQELTNKFEEINFKIDKLSNRLSKIQSDNQLRFQDLEKFVQSGEVIKSTLSASKKKEKLPGSRAIAIDSKINFTFPCFWLLRRESLSQIRSIPMRRNGLRPSLSNVSISL